MHEMKYRCTFGFMFTLYKGCIINTNTKDHKDENISIPAEAVNWSAYIKRFCTDMAFLTPHVGLFCLSELVVVLQSPFWQPHLNGFLMLCWIIDPAKCASSVTIKKASCRFFHTFSFKKQRKKSLRKYFQYFSLKYFWKETLKIAPKSTGEVKIIPEISYYCWHLRYF